MAKATNIDCEVGALMSGELVLWFDGIAVPLHWCSVTDLTEEEEELVLEYV